MARTETCCCNSPSHALRNCSQASPVSFDTGFRVDDGWFWRGKSMCIHCGTDIYRCVVNIYLVSIHSIDESVDVSAHKDNKWKFPACRCGRLISRLQDTGRRDSSTSEWKGMSLRDTKQTCSRRNTIVGIGCRWAILPSFHTI